MTFSPTQLSSLLRSNKKVLISGIVIFHLAMIATGAITVPESKLGLFGKFHAVYRTLTCAGNSFGFFSPNVGNTYTSEFLIDGDESKPLRLEDILPHEVALRTENMTHFFGQSFSKEHLRRSIAASLSTFVFERYPSAKTVTFIAYIYALPPLEARSPSPQPFKKEIYRVMFGRGGPHVSKL